MTTTHPIVAAVPEMPHGERAIFRYELSENGGSTELTVIYRRLTRRTATGSTDGSVL